MSWDLQALLAVIALIGLSLVLIASGYAVHRSIQWRKARLLHRERFIHPRENVGVR